MCEKFICEKFICRILLLPSNSVIAKIAFYDLDLVFECIFLKIIYILNGMS